MRVNLVENKYPRLSIQPIRKVVSFRITNDQSSEPLDERLSTLTENVKRHLAVRRIKLWIQSTFVLSYSSELDWKSLGHFGGYRSNTLNEFAYCRLIMPIRPIVEFDYLLNDFLIAHQRHWVIVLPLQALSIRYDPGP